MFPSMNLAVFRTFRRPSNVWARIPLPIGTSRIESTEATQTRRRSTPYAGSFWRFYSSQASVSFFKGK